MVRWSVGCSVGRLRFIGYYGGGFRFKAGRMPFANVYLINVQYRVYSYIPKRWSFTNIAWLKTTLRTAWASIRLDINGVSISVCTREHNAVIDKSPSLRRHPCWQRCRRCRLRTQRPTDTQIQTERPMPHRAERFYTTMTSNGIVSCGGIIVVLKVRARERFSCRITPEPLYA